MAGRLAQLQLVQNDQYKRLSDKNQYNYRTFDRPGARSDHRPL